MKDDGRLRRWTRVDRLTSKQKAWVDARERARKAPSPWLKAPDPRLDSVLKKLKTALLKVEGRLAGNPEVEAAVQDALRLIDEMGMGHPAAPSMKALWAAADRASLLMAKSRGAVTRVHQAVRSKSFKEALDELMERQRRPRKSGGFLEQLERVPTRRRP